MSVVVPDQEPLWKTNYQQWVTNISNFLRTEILPLITTNHQIIDIMTNDDAMQTWIAVFTQQNVDSIDGKNYETWEKIGDNVMYVQFFEQIIKRVPDIPPSRLNDLGNYYLAKDFQGRFSFERGWTKYLRTNFIPTLDEAEDLVEAMFGALYYLGNNMVKSGVGDVLAKKFMDYFFQGVDINLDVTKPRETIVKEIFRDHLKLKQPKLIVDENQSDSVNPFIASLTIDDQAVDYLNKQIIRYNQQNPTQQLPLFKNILASVQSTSGKRATKLAYDQAVQILYDHGITEAWAKEMKMIINAEKSADPNTYLQAYRKAQEAGYEMLDFGDEIQRAPYSYLTLLGILPDGQRQVLDDIQVKDDLRNNIRLLLLKKYLGLDLGVPITNQ